MNRAIKLLGLAFVVLVMPALGQNTIYVAPIPKPGDPAYVPYQLNQLGEIMRRNEMHSTQLDAINAQAGLSRALAESIKGDEIDSLMSLAQLLDVAGTPEQKRTLQSLIQIKLDQLLQLKLDQLVPPTLREYPVGTTLVFASPGFPWAAEQVAGVLDGNPTPVDFSLADARAVARENATVTGFVEVQVNVYQNFESVKANCHRKDGSQIWSEKVILNTGGGPETLARAMVGRLLKKVHGKACI